MLKELSKRDKEWRKIALKICGCPDLADDLVQEMYLKLHKLQRDKVNTPYVSYTIYHLFLNTQKKAQTTKSIEDCYISENYQECERLDERKIINEALQELSFPDRELLLHTHERSLRKNEELLGISKDILWNQKKNGLNKLKETEAIKKLIIDRWKNVS